jgi:conjugal transfer pilus assembly protein TraW
LKLFGYKSLFGCGFLPAIGFATSFGSIGAVFPVQERSLLEVIQERLQSHPKVSWQKYITSRINRPTSLGLQRANAKRTYYYDPSIVLTHPILGAEGEVLYQAGTRVNGLLSLPQYAPCWLFFNADDRAQLRWAQKTAQTCQSPKLILTGGALVEASQALKRVIYFDQGGALKNQLHLQAVPAFVKREKERLLITEVKISESGDAI